MGLTERSLERSKNRIFSTNLDALFSFREALKLATKLASCHSSYPRIRNSKKQITKFAGLYPPGFIKSYGFDDMDMFDSCF